MNKEELMAFARRLIFDAGEEAAVEAALKAWGLSRVSEVQDADADRFGQELTRQTRRLTHRAAYPPATTTGRYTFPVGPAIPTHESEQIEKLVRELGAVRDMAIKADLPVPAFVPATATLTKQIADVRRAMNEMGAAFNRAGEQMAKSMAAMADAINHPPLKTGDVYLVHCGKCILDGVVQMHRDSVSSPIQHSHDYRVRYGLTCPVCGNEVGRSDHLRVTFGSTNASWPCNSSDPVPAMSRGYRFGTGVVTLYDTDSGGVEVTLFSDDHGELVRTERVSGEWDATTDKIMPPSRERCLAELLSE